MILTCKESGLLGVSGISQDMRELLASDRPKVKEAVELSCYRCVHEIGSLSAPNASKAARIALPGSRLAALVIPTNEKSMIARHTAKLLV